MKTTNLSSFNRLINKKKIFPLKGHLAITYRCNLDCIHCYCKNMRNCGQELDTESWKKIINDLSKAGCVWICFSGGEPLVREDFLELYSYAKRKGLIVSLITNGLGFKDKIIDCLVKSPPRLIEISLNGLSEKVYESVTLKKGSFLKVMQIIKVLAAKGLPLKIKSTCMKPNKSQIVKIKQWAESFSVGGKKRELNFEYGLNIYPGLGFDRSPCEYRLSARQVQEIRGQVEGLGKINENVTHIGSIGKVRESHFLYRCNSWLDSFFIDPKGFLKFCEFSDKFSVDIRKGDFKGSFYKIVFSVLNEKFKTGSKCKDCYLRSYCSICPAIAYLEKGDEEAPVEYYCKLAKATQEKKIR